MTHATGEALRDAYVRGEAETRVRTVGTGKGSVSLVAEESREHQVREGGPEGGLPKTDAICDRAVDVTCGRVYVQPL